MTKEQELKEKMDRFFEELGLSEGIENMNKFEQEIMIPEINRRLKEQKEEFERLIDEKINKWNEIKDKQTDRFDEVICKMMIKDFEQLKNQFGKDL